MSANWTDDEDPIQAERRILDVDDDPLFGHRDGCARWLFSTLPAVLVWAAIIVLWLQPWRP